MVRDVGQNESASGRLATGVARGVGVGAVSRREQSLLTRPEHQALAVCE